MVQDDEENSSPFSRAAQVTKVKSDLNMIDIVAESPPNHEDGSSSGVNPLISAPATGGINVDNLDEDDDGNDTSGLNGVEMREF